MPTPDLSVIIPVYNRGDLIRHTLASVNAASAGLRIETIIVDDGSAPPVATSLDRIGFAATKLIRQENRGLLFARLTGLAAATGRHVLFLDSDDLVGPEKFRLQVEALDATGSDISYTDTGHCALTEAGPGELTADTLALTTNDAAEFYLIVQPAPHSPVFRRSYLDSIVARAFFPPSSHYNAVAEIWFYHNAAPRPATVVKVPGMHTIVGTHPGVRLTNHWEKLGVASLAVMEAFDRSCPTTPETRHARELFGEKAFISWRALPYDFCAEFDRRLLALWRRNSASERAKLGGRRFCQLARVLGPITAGRLLRRAQGKPYRASQTLSDASLVEQWLAQLPAA